MAAFEEKASETKSKAVDMLFDREILDRIMQHPIKQDSEIKVCDKYQGYSLFNRDDMLEFIDAGNKKQTSMEKKPEEKKEETPERTMEEKISTVIIVAQNICKTLNYEVIEISIKESFKPNSGYEILFIMKGSNMVGFLIARRGACQRYPGQYMIDFVCTSVKGISSLLLGACMFAIKTKPMIPAYSGVLSSRIMLSCANGFDNPAAYCSYRKMGFAIDHDLFVTDTNGVTCIKEHIRDLPMSVDVRRTTTDEIVQLMVTSSNKKDPMCDRRLSLEALVKVVDGSKALDVGSTEKLREYIKFTKGEIDINPYMIAFRVYGNMETRDVRVRLLIDSIERGFRIYPYALLKLLNGCKEVVPGGKKRLSDLIKLREEIVLLHKMDYTLRLAFAMKDFEEARKKKYEKEGLGKNYSPRSPPYLSLLRFIFTKATGSIGSKEHMDDVERGHIYYNAFLEIVLDVIRDIRDNRFKHDELQQNLLKSVLNILTIQEDRLKHLNSKSDTMSEEEKITHTNKDIDYVREIDEEMKKFHGMYTPPGEGKPETNCLLIKIAEKIQKLFGEYLEEYSSLKDLEEYSSLKGRVSAYSSPKTPDGSPPSQKKGRARSTSPKTKKVSSSSEKKGRARSTSPKTKKVLPPSKKKGSTY